MTHKHLFFDMDETVAPSREPILDDMFQLLDSFEQDIIIVSGQNVEKIIWQTNDLPAIRLGQNGNEAYNITGEQLWYTPLGETETSEILAHIAKITQALPEQPNPEWNPVENRGGQITFSPVGNTAPVDIKRAYDPDKSKRLQLMEDIPLVSEHVVVKIGGTTSFDYIHKNRHKGTNVQKLIDYMGWNKDECVYYGDGLYPGGNDEAVIGVIETIAVTDHLDTYNKLVATFG